MRVAEWYVRHRYLRADLGTSLGDGDSVVGKRRAANGVKEFGAHDKAVVNTHPVADRLKCLLLAGFGALSVTDVQARCRAGSKVTHRQRGTDGRVHAATECHHDLCSVR